MKQLIKKVLSIIIVLLLIVTSLMAQGDFGSEKELKKQADESFKDDDYASSITLYSQLLSLYPKNADYNYRYGVCLLYSQENKEKPLAYLTFAVGKEGVDDEIYYHLGRAYHLNYRFDDAIAQYTIFKNKRAKTSTKLQVDLQIKQCENGKLLLRNVTDLTVLERKDLNVGEYFRAYDLTQIGAKLVVKPEDLKTKIDIKNKDKSTVVVRQTSMDIYYSSYGEDGKNGRDIYKITKQPNFTWSKPINLGSRINTIYDEDYPYITPDGKTLYFASKGQTSMGGYDIFRSQLDVDGQWGTPQNLDFAINTPDDDIQYVTDPEADFAYFSTKRISPEGRIVVYKIKTERVPVTAAVIKGTFITDADPANLVAKISVKNVQTGKFMGTFSSNERDGKYRLNLTNGTKYEFTVEQSGVPPIVQTVDIPPMKELRPLKQEIQLKTKEGNKMIIYNFFSDTLEDNALARAELFKERANLDVNYEDQIQAGIISEATKKTGGTDNKQLANRNAYVEQANSAQVNNDKTKVSEELNESKNNSQSNNDNNSEGKVETKVAPLVNNTETNKGGAIGNREIVKIAKDDAIETQREADDQLEKANQAFAFASIKSKAAQKKYNEANEAENLAAAAADINAKQVQEDVANKAKKEGDLLSQQAVVAYNLAKDIDQDAKLKQHEADVTRQYAADLDNAVKSNSNEGIAALETQRKELETQGNDNNNYNPENLGKQATSKQAEVQATIERKDELKAEIQESEFDERIARSAIEKNQDQALKPTLEANLKLAIDTKIAKEKELSESDAKIAKLKIEAENLAIEAKLSKEIVQEMSTAESQSLTSLPAAEKSQLDAQISNFKGEPVVQNTQTTQALKTETKSVATNNNKNEATSISDANKSKVVTSPNKALSSNSNNSAITEKNTNSLDEKLKEKLLAEYDNIIARVDSLKNILSNETNQNKIADINKKISDLNTTAVNKNINAEQINYNINNQEFEKSKIQIIAKISTLSEAEKANANNTWQQIDANYANAIAEKSQAAESNNLEEKEALMKTATNAQNISLVRQRQLLEQVNSAALASSSPKVNEFKGFNTDRNTPVAEVVNPYRPQYVYNSNIELSLQDAEKVKATEEYLKFASLLEQAITIENQADDLAKSYNAKKQEGEEKVIESQQLIDLASEEKKKAKKQALAEEAIATDNKGRDLLIEADTIKINAQQEMLKAAAIKGLADKFIASLPVENKDKIIAAFKNQIAITPADVPQDMLASQEQAKDTKASETKAVASSDKKTVENKSKTGTTATNNSVNEIPTKNENGTTAKVASNKSSAEKQVNQNDNKEAVVSQNNTVQQVQKPADKESVLAAIKASVDYQAYDKIKKDAEEATANAKALKLIADSVKNQSERDVQNSNDMLEFAAAQSKKDARKEAQSKAEAYDKSSKDDLVKADSITLESGKLLAKANDKQKEADAYLKKLDEQQAKAIMMAYNNIVDETTIAAAQKQNKSATNQSNTVATNTANPTLVKKQQSDVKLTEEYKQFLSLRENAELAKKQAEYKQNEVDSMKTLSSQKLEESNNILDQASVLKKKQRKPLVEQAVALDYESQNLNRQADSLAPFVNEAKKLASDKKGESEKYLAGLDKNLALRIMRAIEGIPEPEIIEETTNIAANEMQNNSVANAENVAKNGDKKLVTKPPARNLNTSAGHGLNNPIPMNEKLPEGIVFKVQIGAFNRTVNDNAFGSITPIMGETIQNSNLIRYTAGLFGNFEEASATRKQLNTLNFNDAFVVAYCYGKRMSVTEARNLVAAGKDCKTGQSSNSVVSNEVKNKTQNISLGNNVKNATIENETSPNNLNTVASIQQGETLPQTNIVEVKGLVYTIQVGVYSKPVKAGQLYNITPLYYELNQKNQYRYTSGIFNDITEANKAKNIIVQIGVADAFVTAYLNGKRIPVEQAAVLVAQQGKSVFATGTAINVLPAVIPNSNIKKLNEGVSVPTNVEPKTKAAQPAINIIYKVQLGAFRNEVPVEIMNKYLTIANMGIANFKSADLTIYTVGSYSNLDAANIAKAEVVAKGIPDAFVIAFNNGEKISVETAKTLKGE